MAKYVAEHLPDKIFADLATSRSGDLKTSIVRGFLNLDEEVKERLNNPSEGTTVIVALIDEKHLVLCARPPLSRGGGGAAPLLAS